MFKILALVVALSGSPIDVLVSNKSFDTCPPSESLLQTKIELQAALELRGEKVKVDDPVCVSADNYREQAMKMLRERKS